MWRRRACGVRAAGRRAASTAARKPPPDLADPWRRKLHGVTTVLSAAVGAYYVLEHEYYDDGTEHVFSGVRRWYRANVRSVVLPEAPAALPPPPPPQQ